MAEECVLFCIHGILQLIIYDPIWVDFWLVDWYSRFQKLGAVKMYIWNSRSLAWLTSLKYSKKSNFTIISTFELQIIAKFRFSKSSDFQVPFLHWVTLCVATWITRDQGLAETFLCLLLVMIKHSIMAQALRSINRKTSRKLRIPAIIKISLLTIKSQL